MPGFGHAAQNRTDRRRIFAKNRQVGATADKRGRDNSPREGRQRNHREVFKSSTFADVSLDQWLALTPPELVKAHVALDDWFMQALRRDKVPVVPA